MTEAFLPLLRAAALLSQVSAWEDFPERVGLTESPDKVELTATSKRGLEALRSEAPDPTKVNEDFEDLGVCARFKPRSNSAKETSRLHSALRVITILGKPPIAVGSFFQKESRCLGTSKVAYGWLSRCATQRDCWRVWGAVRRGQRCLFRAKSVLEGCGVRRRRFNRRRPLSYRWTPRDTPPGTARLAGAGQRRTVT